MSGARKTLRGVKTMGSLVDLRRTRTAAGALLELSALANEKERLNKELTAAARRQAEIVERLKEIAAKEHRLQGFVKEPDMVGIVCPQTPPDTGRRIKAKEIRY
jgi:predicted nuclease with TOPRIM domain